MVSTVTGHKATFRHEALLYAGEDGFVEEVGAFVREALEAEEPILVVVGAPKIGRLKEALGGEPADVLFADMAEVGANPARIIQAWRDFVEARSGDGRGFRGVGEPIYPERSPAELVECQRHESLLNVAFADGPSWWLVCPYDTEALESDVIEAALRTHPLVWNGGHDDSPVYEGLEAAAAPFTVPLPEPGSDVSELAFEDGGLDAVRGFVVWHAADAGFGDTRLAELVLAVHEIASNSLRHGGGHGLLRIWREDDMLVCELSDAGRIADPLVGRLRPDLKGHGGRGVWMANQLCDLVQIRVLPTGSVVRLHMRRD